MTDRVTTWQPFPETAQQIINRPILVRGRWRKYDPDGPTMEDVADRPFANLTVQQADTVGEWEVVVARWSSIMSNGKGYQWFTGWFTPMVNVNVDFTEWMDIPE